MFTGTGVVKKFVDEKGYGFIAQDPGPNGEKLEDVFFHFTKFGDSFVNGMLQENVTRVSFTYEQGERGFQVVTIALSGAGQMAGAEDNSHDEDDMA